MFCTKFSFNKRSYCKSISQEKICVLRIRCHVVVSTQRHILGKPGQINISYLYYLLDNGDVQYL
jgi:hypothetical protein